MSDDWRQVLSSTDEFKQGPGWYGKLPALGDFASRRVNESFIRPWDDWLQRAVSASRADLGEQWLDVYLSSPVWNFALFPNVLHPELAYAGCLMSSVDRVGRYFPLTACAELSYPQLLAEELAMGTHWYRGLAQIMMNALSPQGSVEEFDSQVNGHAFASNSLVGQQGFGLAQALHAANQTHMPASGVTTDLSQCLPDTQRAYLLQAFNGMSLWWTTVPTTSGMPNTIYWTHRGMLPPQHYTRLLSCQT
jgi:type VI secretion system protein ImpM